jgi:C_GCAxxG_C_C family probable redox protein
MNKAKTAAALMKEHRMNCAQTVLSMFCNDLGIDLNTALKVAMGFGGGMGGSGRTCGAVTGAYMVLGLAQKISPENPRESVEKTSGLMKKFNRKFMKLHSSMTCKELTGYDLSDKKDRDDAHRKEVFATVCPIFVGDSVKILENLQKSK